MNAPIELKHANIAEPPAVGRQELVVDRLREVLAPHALLFREEDTRPYECDGLSAFRQLPMVVALPEDESQVRAVLRICRELDVPVVARGAGTGLSGGAMPHASGVVLSLAKLNRILSLDPLARLARVQPGVRNLAISEAAAPHGLYYAPDPSSQIACSIGGNVAENSGGVHCLKYGLTVHNVLRVRGITIEGEVMEFGCEALDSPGLDLLAAVIGSEGMLAVVTEVTVKLVPKPQLAQVVMASFDDVAQAGDAVARIKAGYDLDAQAILLAESDGTPEEVAEEIARIEKVLRGAGATAIKVSSSEAERLRFWSGRKNAFPAAGRISPDYYCMDGTIPRKNLGRMLIAIEQMESRYQLRCMNVFHAGDGNLHPLILFDANDPDEWRRAEDFGAEILAKCVEFGGTVTGEHGVGIEKINSMCVQFTERELETFFALKRAFDPQGLLIPVKSNPTLSRCAEFGKMHVHAGKLPFSELPRF
ncbi:MAG: FAD-linked oxidase C-terminal domain-containing protein [Quisquiliibacterium sp.]